MTRDEVLKLIEKFYEAKYLSEVLPDGIYFDFFSALENDPDLKSRFERAQEIRSEKFAEEMLQIADTETDWVRSRNKIDVRRWYATKMKPQRFGDKIAVEHTHHIGIGAALEEAKRRALLPSDLAIPVESKVIDTKEVLEDKRTDYKSVDDVKIRDAIAFDPDEDIFS